MKDRLTTVAWLLVLALWGCGDRGMTAQNSCHGEARAKMVLRDRGTAKLNDVSSEFGYFLVENDGHAPIVLPGWRKSDVFWMEYPAGALEARNGDWNPVVPLLGSFPTVGEDRLTLLPGKVATVASRIDFGVRPEQTSLRAVLHTIDQHCVLSEPFALRRSAAH